MRIEPPSKEGAARYDAIVCKSMVERAIRRDRHRWGRLLFASLATRFSFARESSLGIARERNRHTRAISIRMSV